MRMLKEFLTHNWFAKLFSLVLATMLWITISSEANSEIGIVIPLEYKNVPAEIGIVIPLEYKNVPARLEVTGDTTNTVEVRLRGPATLIREISPQDISATVDLGGLKPGEKIVQLSQQNVRAPFGIEIVRVNPAQVKLNLEPTLTKMLPVVVQTLGEPAAGYEIAGMTVTPATVEVQGPASKVELLESVPTAIVRVSGRNASFAESVDLDLPDAMVRLQLLTPVEVRINIKERGSK